MLNQGFKNTLATHLQFKFSHEHVVRRLSVADTLTRAVKEKPFSNSFTWLLAGSPIGPFIGWHQCSPNVRKFPPVIIIQEEE